MQLQAAQGLSLIRIAFGLYFVVSGLRKTMTGWLSGSEGLTSFVQRNLEGPPTFYRGFLEGLVLPNADIFSQLVVVGEWVTGISLLFGVLTRVGAVVGMWLTLNYMLAKGLPTYDGSQDRLFFVGCAVFAVTAAGLMWGLDGALRPYLASTALGRWLTGVPSRAPYRAPQAMPQGHRIGDEPARRRAA